MYGIFDTLVRAPRNDKGMTSPNLCCKILIFSLKVTLWLHYCNQHINKYKITDCNNNQVPLWVMQAPVQTNRQNTWSYKDNISGSVSLNIIKMFNAESVVYFGIIGRHPGLPWHQRAQFQCHSKHFLSSWCICLQCNQTNPHCLMKR